MSAMYTLCNQTVTVYNAVKVGAEPTYRKTVFVGSAFLDLSRQWKGDEKGTAASDFLLVVPQGACELEFVPPITFAELADKSGKWTLAKNDKVLLGEGADVADATAWAALIPAKVDNLVVIGRVEPCRGLDGAIAHIEAGS